MYKFEFSQQDIISKKQKNMIEYINLRQILQ